MAEQRKPDDSDPTEFPSRLPEDPTPAQLKAMGAFEIPPGRKEAANAVMRLTQDWKKVFYWAPKPQSWWDKKLGGNEPPHGRRVSDHSFVQCRPWDEFGLVIHDPNIWADGLVRLRYGDKVELIICLEDLHKGVNLHGDEVRKKIVPVQPGEKDLIGVMHDLG